MGRNNLTLLDEQLEERLRDSQAVISHDQVFELYYIMEKVCAERKMGKESKRAALNDFFTIYLDQLKNLHQKYYKQTLDTLTEEGALEL